MSYTDEQELLNLTKENNVLLKQILYLLNNNGPYNFVTDVIANVIGNRIDGGTAYARR